MRTKGAGYTVFATYANTLECLGPAQAPWTLAAPVARLAGRYSLACASEAAYVSLQVAYHQTRLMLATTAAIMMVTLRKSHRESRPGNTVPQLHGRWRVQAGFILQWKKRMCCRQSHTHQPPSGILMMLLDRKRPSNGTAAGARGSRGSGNKSRSGSISIFWRSLQRSP